MNIGPKIFNICQSGGISPNLVALDAAAAISLAVCEEIIFQLCREMTHSAFRIHIKIFVAQKTLFIARNSRKAIQTFGRK